MYCLGAIGWLIRAGADTADPGSGIGIGLINAIVSAWLIIAVVTFLPAGLTIAYAEIKAKRNVSFFIGMGIFIAMLPTAPFIVAYAFSTKPLLGAIHWTVALAIAGFVAGFVYWAIVGRKSGLEDEARPPPLGIT